MKLQYPLKVHVITQNFGDNPATYNPMGLKAHSGVDFRTRNQSDADGIAGHTFVYAAASGVLETVRNDGKKGYGLHIRIRHMDGSLTIYGHLSSVMVHQGDKVSQGDKIGVTGNSGFSSAPHLHFEYRPANESVNNGYAGAVDPLPFLMNDITKPVVPLDEEHIKAIKFVSENHVMNIVAAETLNNPISRQDLALVIHRLYVLLKS